MTSLSRLLTNEVTPSEIMEAAKKIVGRKDYNSALPRNKLSKLVEESRPNFHVSEACEHCVNSAESPTPPILMEIVYAGKKVDWSVKFLACGDGLELIALAGVTSGFCYKCEHKYINPNFGRGLNFSRHEISFFGENMELEKPEARSLKKANKYSKHFHE